MPPPVAVAEADFHANCKALEFEGLPENLRAGVAQRARDGVGGCRSAGVANHGAATGRGDSKRSEDGYRGCLAQFSAPSHEDFHAHPCGNS